jgi:fermentation-respiration switch protein FrsA (DUF1100 family)
MMRLYFPFFRPPTMSAVKYDSLSLIESIQSPLLFIHGQFDHTIPIAMARTLHERAKAPKDFYEIAGADHNDTYLVGGQEYFAIWQKFFANCLDRQESGKS